MLCIERIHKPNIWRAAEATQKLKNIRLTGKSTETFKESKINSLSLSVEFILLCWNHAEMARPCIQKSADQEFITFYSIVK